MTFVNGSFVESQDLKGGSQGGGIRGGVESESVREGGDIRREDKGGYQRTGNPTLKALMDNGL
jgi:hypothetical protein